MWNKVLFASLLATSCSIAGAAPTPPTPPGPPAPNAAPPAQCTQTGDVLFQIADRVEHGSTLPADKTWTITVRDNGAWMRTAHDERGKLARDDRGCLDRTQLDAIRRSLANAHWVVKQAQATCAAVSGTYLEYSSHGRVVWTQRMCQLEYLDDDSRQAVETISKLLDEVSKPGSIETSGHKH
jgi:hypothetical protein